ncbi:uroporphyrinogen-III C-methyltransferase [Pedobacter sp. SD-b]|uniref:uroporphyrinogen-III C-methyltransferase n=1 Tax=Pedobacter segetis TaxID=2793069 RepID=A0ABS1BPI2_9SPHI|nr:uroporphyrinogen-III C-methyltransferase [Pedobacter segetis]MBK0384356.1 uroporphyrinogen-III C-methyltransferase [Pedobacter segetis]
MENIDSELIIVGAGPGDPELITIKAIKVLEKADVILYDNLANKDLLKYAKRNCDLVYVGKTPYQEYTTQEKIHELIANYLQLKLIVVRLKGGDPFIFGRGMEEMMFARDLGYKASYIPGITSMLAIGLCDIPLTHRGISEGLWMITGTKKDGSLSRDVCLAMQSKTTLVIYMGMKNLPFIIQEAIKCGKPDTPAALIQHASLPHMKMVKGKLCDLQKLAEKHGITHPALIVIGEVAGLG